MNDLSLSQRRRAVAVAGHSGDEVTARNALDDVDPTVRAVAIGALDRLGAATEHDLARALSDEAALVRRRALALVAHRGGDLPPSTLPLLDDPDPVVAEMAAWTAGERTPPEVGAVEALVAVAGSHPVNLVREAAVASLGAIGDPAGLPTVLAAFGERATIRRRAVIALAAFEGPEVDEALHRALEDRDRQVRQTAEDLLAPENDDGPRP